MEEKILSVNNLRVSFKTGNGLVRAVRGISFDLNKGETLAIVGESGSGKSVTAKSILGINAANTIVESGEIIYRGDDLLKYTEKDFNRVRGNELTMIFQDPLSSLDPVMKIGKQMTEATLYNNKVRRKNSSKELKKLTGVLAKQGFAIPAGMLEGTESGGTDKLKGSAKADAAKLNGSAKADAEKFNGSAKAGTEKLNSSANPDIAKLSAVLAETEKGYTEKKRAVVSLIQAKRSVFEAEKLDRKACESASKELTKLVEESLNPLDLSKNSAASTFRSSMKKDIERYFLGLKQNPREEARVAKETKEREVKLSKNQNAPKVVPAAIVDTDSIRENLKRYLNELELSYADEIRKFDEGHCDFDSQAARMISYLQKLKKDSVTVVSKQEAYEKAIGIMKDVGIKDPEKRFEQYPHEFSGGMRQRIVIAIAIAANPEILICDEPTTALDVTIQAQILELINDLKAKRQLSILFITHDLGVVANMADKVAVMYAGRIVEYGTAEEIFYDPRHPYTWALLSSMPNLETKEKLEAIPGTPPNMIYPPVGDAFAERNQYAMKIDFKKQPPFFKVSDTHYAATWLLHPDAPKIDPPKSVTERIEQMKKMHGLGVVDSQKAVNDAVSAGAAVSDVSSGNVDISAGTGKNDVRAAGNHSKEVLTDD